jgi:fructuronate reductase
LTAAIQALALKAHFRAPTVHIITLTITEKGYCLDAQGELDLSHPDIAHDLAQPEAPVSAIGWLGLGLRDRCRGGGAPLTIISCDNLKDNGLKLGAAVAAFMARAHPEALPWLSAVAFPRSVVDCIVPASDAASRLRVSERLGVTDGAAVQREPYAQWVIEDAFAGPRPAWERAGVQLVPAVEDYARLKLHVLNACHSALAYLGLARGYALVRDAVADPELARFLDELVECEIRPALSPLAVDAYWSIVRRRFANAHIDHRLAQIAEDGAQKLAQRVFPLMLANLQSGAPLTRLARIVRAWLARQPLEVRAALDDASLIPPAIGSDPTARAAILAARI